MLVYRFDYREVAPCRFIAKEMGVKQQNRAADPEGLAVSAMHRVGTTDAKKLLKETKTI